jgi:MFS family permease
LLLRIGYRPTSIAGFVLLTAGFAFLSMYGRETARFWLYVDLVLIGAGLGLTMLTLLIAVQQSVSRVQLGIATSLNQFSRSIGGAIGVALMGTVLSAGLVNELNKYAEANGNLMTTERAAELSANPNALIEPEARVALPPDVLNALQKAMATSIHKVFWVGAILSGMALLVCFFLPRRGSEEEDKEIDSKSIEPLINSH